MQTVQVVSWHCVPPPKTLIYFEHARSVPPQKGIRVSPGGLPRRTQPYLVALGDTGELRRLERNVGHVVEHCAT